MITNIHVHTPFSFSTFRSIEELVATAAAENVVVLGINDLNSIDGFREFTHFCKAQHIYPIFNIEFSVEHDAVHHTAAHHRNVTPYFTGKISGKALPYPIPFPDDVHNLIASIWKGSQDRIWKMIETLNTLLAQRNIPVVLDYNEIRSSFAKASIYEQHIAQALYQALGELDQSESDLTIQIQSLFEDDAYDISKMKDGEVRQHIIDRLLAPGKKAYVPTNADTALTLAQARHLILQTGGIPCYQCRLAPDQTATEKLDDPASLAKKLENRGFFAIEFIPQWTSMQQLRKYMTYFHKENFCVSIGTGRFNTINKSTIPLTNDGTQLDKDLLDIGYQGACILAAHQERRIRKRSGYLDESGTRIISPDKLSAFIKEGEQRILKVIHS